MLIEARKLPVLDHAYARYGRRMLRRAFARVWVGGAPLPLDDGPNIVFLNHSAWWDPILCHFLSHDVFRRDGYGLMEGAQLLKYPFFRRIGCFGAVGPDGEPGALGPEDARGLALYAAATLRGGPRRTLWIFPQGALLPPRVALAFRSGVARLSRAVPEAPLLPLAVRYELRAEERPEVFVRVGEPVRGGTLTGDSPARATRRLEARLRETLEALDADLREPEPTAYRVVLAGRHSISEFYDRTVGRLRARRAG
jgi:1-acyl-sn-glycerol-3-phosphate acyltransferase